jgi:hypothetical protein
MGALSAAALKPDGKRVNDADFGTVHKPDVPEVR